MRRTLRSQSLMWQQGARCVCVCVCARARVCVCVCVCLPPHTNHLPATFRVHLRANACLSRACFWCHVNTYKLVCARVGVWVCLQGVYEGRSKLPAPKPLGRGFSIWSLLKNMIGKDLTRLTMPATINEPTSTLQRYRVDTSTHTRTHTYKRTDAKHIRSQTHTHTHTRTSGFKYHPCAPQ